MSKSRNAAMADPSVKPLMHIQVTTDSNIQGHEELIERVEVEVRHVLGRFAHQIMSVEVHFTDENSAKHGSHDKRCLMEARCSGRPPVAVSNESATIEGSFHGAMKNCNGCSNPVWAKPRHIRAASQSARKIIPSVKILVLSVYEHQIVRPY